MKRILLISGGYLSLSLGIAGIFLPVLPTTPFLLLSSACFARSSQKAHKWLHEHRHLGPYIRSYQAGQGIPMRAKILTIVLLWVSVSFSMIKVDFVAVHLLLIAIAGAITLYMVRIPTYSQNI